MKLHEIVLNQTLRKPSADNQKMAGSANGRTECQSTHYMIDTEASTIIVVRSVPRQHQLHRFEVVI